MRTRRAAASHWRSGAGWRVPSPSRHHQGRGRAHVCTGFVFHAPAPLGGGLGADEGAAAHLHGARSPAFLQQVVEVGAAEAETVAELGDGVGELGGGCARNGQVHGCSTVFSCDSYEFCLRALLLNICSSCAQIFVRSALIFTEPSWLGVRASGRLLAWTAHLHEQLF